MKPLTIVVIAMVGILPSASAEKSGSSGTGGINLSGTVLSRDAVVPLTVVSRFFPQATQEMRTGPNATTVGRPKATRSVIYANSDRSKKVTISVDEYASSTDALAAFEEAVRKSKTVAGFKPLRTTNLGPHAFIGTVTQGGETHIGVGALDDTLIVGATLAGYEATRANVAKVMELTRRQQKTAKAVVDRSQRK